MLLLQDLYLEIGNTVSFLLVTLTGIVQEHRVSHHPCNTTALVFGVIYASPDFVRVNNSLKQPWSV